MMQLRFRFCMLLLLAVVLPLQAKPTFDKMAEVLLDVLDDRPHYPRPRPYGPPAGPLIQEGYDHGYDYYYGGGGAHVQGNGVVVGNPWPAQPPPPPQYGYYRPAPVRGPVKGYYPPPQYPQAYQAPPATYGEDHGYSYGGHHVEGHGGYKQHGY